MSTRSDHAHLLGSYAAAQCNARIIVQFPTDPLIPTDPLRILSFQPIS